MGEIVVDVEVDVLIRIRRHQRLVIVDEFARLENSADLPFGDAVDADDFNVVGIGM